MSSHVKNLTRKVIRDRNRLAAAEASATVSPRISLSMDALSSEMKEKILSCKCVAAYMPLPDEPDISAVLDALTNNGAKLCFPKVNREEMAFFEADVSSCRNVGSFGILEPSENAAEVDPSKIDLVFVPAMAFSLEGKRLGRGKGYYDKFFSRAKENGFSGMLIGVVRKKNLFLHLPFDVWDLTVDAILTEEGHFMTESKERSEKR